jgi:hypothetical protein
MSNPIANSVQRVPSAIKALVFGAAILAGIYWCVTASGPYAWLVRLQVDLMGAYYLKLSILLMILVCMVPASLVLAVLGAVLPSSDTTDFSGVANSTTKPNALGQRAQRAPRSFALMLAGLVCILVGGWFYGTSLLAGELTTYRYAEDSAWPPESNYLELSGVLVQESAMVWSDDTTNRSTVYVLLSPFAASGPPAAAPQQATAPSPDSNGGSDGASNGGKDEPAPAPVNDGKLDSTPVETRPGERPDEYRIILKMSESTYNLMRSGDLMEGTLGRAPSGIVRGDLQDAGFTLASDARIFAVAHTPNDSKMIGLIMLVSGLVSSGLFAGLFLMLSRAK